MRNYIVKTIIDLSSNESTLRSEKTFINKLDLVLVQILKKDWPQYWPSFIQEIVDSSLINTSLCENNMKILKLLRLVILPVKLFISSNAPNFVDTVKKYLTFQSII
jgi:hypothetical protein